MTTINPKWIAALRSDKYTQTQQTLRDKDGFCCLGVGCDVLMPDLPQASWEEQARTQKGNFAFIFGENEDVEILDDGTLSRELFPLLGIDSELETKLIKMNDDEGKSFSEIADFLEALNSQGKLL